MVGTAEQNDGRIIWMDGLRGLAAMQVVLLHYTTAFLPGLGLLDRTDLHYSWEQIVADSPLFAVLNGYMAVYLFFLLSGAALTYAFGRRPFVVVQSAMRRILRLGLPMLGATLVAALLLWAWPGAHVGAAALTGSQRWLGAVSPGAVTAGMTLHPMLLEGMFAGFSETSMLPGFIVTRLGLDPLAHALNAPLWTLHVEFIGSLLVILMVMIRAGAPRWLHGGVCVAFTLMFVASPLALFAVGHLTAPLLLRRRSGRAWGAAGLGLLLAGLALCSGGGMVWLDRGLALLPAPPFGARSDGLHLRFSLAALMVFYAVALLPATQAVLTRPIARRLGSLSFSLYLVHFPVLFTITSALFLYARPRLSYGVAAAVCSAAGIGLTFVIAALFQRWVDWPAIRLSRCHLARRPRSVLPPPVPANQS